MRYMVFVKMREDVGRAPESLHRAMDAAMRAQFAAGSMLDAGGLAGAADSTEIELRAGEVITTDGPWSEAKEVAGGYAIIEARSHDEALEAARRVIDIHRDHWPGWEGSVEVRPIHDSPPGD
jgi:hypothetical protein